MDSKSLYLDYNSTSPLAENVKTFLGKGDVFFANPSSQHRMGKKVAKEINSVKSFLGTFFNFSSTDNYQILFHSGATEALNLFFNQLSLDSIFFYMPTDHACVLALTQKFKSRGGKVVPIPILSSGLIDRKEFAGKLESFSNHKKVINITWVNNETGVVQDLYELTFIKDFEDTFLHIDAVQSVGKVSDYRKLPSFVDAYTFSGHKFGALKGCGFSFFKSSYTLESLIIGGGQQDGLRSGTLNTTGILSLKYALEELLNEDESKKILALKNEILKIVKKYSSFCYIKNESFNTICLIHKNKKSDEILIHFDMNGMAVSSGSACSSGSLSPSHVLEAMGYKEEASQSVRISLGKSLLSDEEFLLGRLNAVLKDLN